MTLDSAATSSAVLTTSGAADSWSSANASLFMPSVQDIALAGPRMLMKLGALVPVPAAINNAFSGGLGQRMIPGATPLGMVDAATTASATTESILITEALAEAQGAASRFSLEGARSFGSIFSYATSKWALCCVAMAILLNRTAIYASTRRNLSLTWKMRLLLRAVPIILLVTQARWALQSIQCQTSPDFSLLRWGNVSKSSDLMFTQNGGLLHTLSSSLLFGASDLDSCTTVHMIPTDDDEPAPMDKDSLSNSSSGPIMSLSGSLSLLWPLYKTISFSQFVEVLSCAVQGRQVAQEARMSLFELSLAFAEAEAAVGTHLGWGPLGDTTALPEPTTTYNATLEATHIAITRSMIMKRVNTTPEVLLVAFLSAMNHITSHVLAIFNLQGRLRLLNTGFWGLIFISFIVWSASSFSLDDLQNQSILRYPTVTIVGFIPHVLVLIGIISCTFIYGIALVLSTIAPPLNQDASSGDLVEQPDGQHVSLIQRLMRAHHNLQANVPLAGIRVTMHMDFYTALLKAGFSMMTMASEAVYLNESRGISVKERTWLEEERLQEIEAIGAQWLGPSFRSQGPDSQSSDGLADNFGLVAAKDQSTMPLQISSSGYAKEMTAKPTTKVKGQERHYRDGVGATERSGRWVMALEFFLGINRLLVRWWATLFFKLLTKLGLQRRPGWLIWLVGRPGPKLGADGSRDSPSPESLKFYLLNLDGELSLPKDENVDVESEMRRRLLNDQNNHWNDEEEQKLEKNLYGWWLSGGWWGSEDNSGNFNPDQKELDEDTTSVISFSTTSGDDEQNWESDSENDGQRTPTQRHPWMSRESTPMEDVALHPADLATLLHPKTPEQRAAAHSLAAHLESDSIMTRSRYKTHTQRERMKVLTSTRQRPPEFRSLSPSGKLTLEEEAQLLEYLIISRRGFHDAAATHSNAQPVSWSKGASGMGEGGPLCVVCQTSPRSIIVWPCRCLSLCDDCRVTLAMNNFDKCVCCRREVTSFSRIFVP